MNSLFIAARDIQGFILKKGWKYCVIGGLALQRWGKPRQTLDVDLTVLTGFGNEEKFARALLEKFEARVKNPLNFAVERRVLLLKTSGGTPIDISFGGLPYEERVVKRATPFAFAPGMKIITCSAEDLIVLKAFAERPQDWIDVENVIIRQGDKLDWKQILREIRPLAELKESREIISKLEKMRDNETL